MFINSALADSDTITIQDADNVPDAPPSMESGLTSLVPMILIFVVFYFLLIRPQEKKKKAQESLVSGVKKGEEVLTNTGIYGVVSKINDSDNTIMLKIANDVEVKMLKSAIVDIVSRAKSDSSSNMSDAKEKSKKNSSKKIISNKK